MGVRRFRRWLTERYPCVIEKVRENQMPDFDNLYMDICGLIHTYSDDAHSSQKTEDQMFEAIFHHIEMTVRLFKPSKVIFIAVDGVAPRAKMYEQRGRRFRRAYDAKREEDKAIKKIEKLPKGKKNPKGKKLAKAKKSPKEKPFRFDSNCITSGTSFMTRLQKYLEYRVNLKITEDKLWQGKRVFLSGPETPGEGEHKIMSFIRAERMKENYDPYTRHVLECGDADLIMLGLIACEPNFWLLTSGNTDFGKDAVELTTFDLLHFSILREYIALEFGDLKDVDWFNVENIIDDWVLLGFLVGNDFIPHLPDLFISDNALPKLYKAYIDVLPSLGGYINDGGVLNLSRFEKFLGKLAEATGSVSTEVVHDTDIAGASYQECDGHTDGEQETAQQVSDYVQTIQWILHYYYNGVQSWSWYYPHHSAPCVSILKNFSDLKLTFEKDEALPPFEHLLSVLPPASKNLIPKAYWHLLDETSPLRDFYHIAVEGDFKDGPLENERFNKHLPFIDEVLLRKEMQKHEHELTEEEKKRNCHSPHHLYTTDVDNPHTVVSPSRRKHPDINNCIAKCDELHQDEFYIDINKIKKGFLEGVRRDIFCHGFATLRHLNYESEFKNGEEISRNDGAKCILTIKDPPLQPSTRELANLLLGNTVYVEWPHFKEVKVVALSDDKYRYMMEGDSTSVQEFDLPPAEVMQWKAHADRIAEEYFEKKRVRIGPTRVILYASPMVGRGYAFKPEGATLETKFADFSLPYAYQVAVKDIKVQEKSLEQLYTLGEIFPRDSTCFMLGGKFYGSRGKVYMPENDRVQVILTVSNEPDLDFLKTNKNPNASTYLEGYQVAKNISGNLVEISSWQVSRLTGSVRVIRGSKTTSNETSYGSTFNIGLNVKFGWRKLYIPEYTRMIMNKKDRLETLYSLKLVEILREYVTKFSQMISNGKDFEEPLYEDDIFVGCNYGCNDVTTWLEQQPTRQAPRYKYGSMCLESPVVQGIQKTVAQVKQSTNTTKEFRLNPQLLFKPNAGIRNLIPDAKATFQLFDRVINVREGIAVPLGLRGVVIGICKVDEYLDTWPHHPGLHRTGLYDVVFDDEFPDGVELRCVGKRGYRLPPTSLINISYGIRKPKEQLNAATTKVSRMQILEQQTPNTAGQHEQSSMANLRSPGSTVDSRTSLPSGGGMGARQNNQKESNYSQVPSSLNVRKHTDGSTSSFAATSDINQAVSPPRQIVTAQQPRSNMQSLGGRAETHPWGQRNPAVQHTQQPARSMQSQGAIPCGRTGGRGDGQHGQRDTQVQSTKSDPETSIKADSAEPDWWEG